VRAVYTLGDSLNKSMPFVNAKTDNGVMSS